MLFSTLFLSLACLLPLALCAEDFYKLLNIDKSASERDIKKAYRTLSKKYHPDKNPGNDTASQRFVQIAEAYDALSAPETRKIYDQYGHEGLSQHKSRGASSSHDPFDLFSRFFGGSGHFGHQSGQRGGPDMEVRISVPLKDFYTGAEHEFQLERQEICAECEGTGSADGTVASCEACGGRGAVLQKHMLAPGIFQQVQMQCDRCGGAGKTIVRPCKVCGGTRVTRGTATHTLHVERGMPRGGKVVYENEADESPDWVAGDLVVVVMEKEAGLTEGEGGGDGVFMRRKGRDLFWTEVLSLREAWMGGWERELVHLDGHMVRIGRERGTVVQPGQVQVVSGEGMPVPVGEQDRERAGEEEYGDLVVEFVVVLPDRMGGGMEKEFWALWEKWRGKVGVDLGGDLGRPPGRGGKGGHGEL